MGAFDEILKLLQGAGAEHHVMEHEPVRTSEQAAQVRARNSDRARRPWCLNAATPC